MDQPIFLEMFLAVILANFLIVVFAYGMRRVIYDEMDLKGLLCMLISLLSVLFTALVVRMS